jgi:hypothetical protein
MLGLDPDPQGYAIYLIDTVAGWRTLIRRDLSRLHAVLDVAGQDARSRCCCSAVSARLSSTRAGPARSAARRASRC